MIKKEQITVGRLICVYTNRGHIDYAIITWVNEHQNACKYTYLDTLIETQEFEFDELYDVVPASKKEVFLGFSNQKKKLNAEIKKLHDKKLNLAQMQVKAKLLIKTSTGK
jgi:translation initiation factor 2 alpha subunit (eIF-2alpha)